MVDAFWLSVHQRMAFAVDGRYCNPQFQTMRVDADVLGTVMARVDVDELKSA